MQKIFMFSGIDKKKGFTKKQTKELLKNIPSNLTISFIASEFYKYDKSDLKYENTLKFFNSIKLTFKETFLIDGRLYKEDVIERLSKTDIIFLMGGDPKDEMDSINDYKITEIINSKNYIIGVSAGSMNMAKYVYYIDQDKFIEYPGLGLTKINIYPHLDLKNEEYINECLKLSNLCKLIVLPNESFIEIFDGEAKIIGKSYQTSNDKLELM